MKIKLLTLIFGLGLSGAIGAQAQNVHVTNDADHPVPVTGTLSGGGGGAATVADGADVTQGSKADAKSTATDTTPVTLMQVAKEISAMEQAPASRAVTNAGTFATQSILTTGTAQIGHLEANQSSNVAQINGVTPLMGNGASGTGAQRVTLANDSTGILSLTTGTASIGHLEANQSSNIAQINGVTPLMGAGNTGTGSPRVTIASDQAVIPVKELASTITTGQVTAGGAATLVAANAARYKLTVRNQDASLSVYVGPATVTTANGALIKAGESRVFKGATLLQVVAASGSPVVDYVDESY